MPDETDATPSHPGRHTEPHPGQHPDQAAVSWPLVERRRLDSAAPDGDERRDPEQPAATAQGAPLTTPASTLSAAVIWPFRLAAAVGAVVRANDGYDWHHWRVIATSVAMGIYTAYACWRPLPYRNDRVTRARILGEQVLNTAAVMLTGQWSSPFVLFFVPTGMVAGFTAGGLVSAQLAAAAVAVVTAQHVPSVGARTAIQDGALWAALLGLVAFTSGLAYRAAHDAARQQQVALDRVSRLAEANSLLFSLQRVAQSLPASLDLEDVLDSTVGRLRTMVQHDALAVYLTDDDTGLAIPARTLGIETTITYALAELPRGLRLAAESPKTVRLDDLADADSISPGARSGLYTALRARGSLVGFIALEGNGQHDFGQQQTEILHGLTEPFGIAIDNARMFQRIRTMAADEERSRIARELHDHVGSSLALIGFEVDRAMHVASDGGEVGPVLVELRHQVSLVVKDVRNTLLDLRTEVTDTRDLTATASQFLHHVQQRSGIVTACTITLDESLPLMIERELWQILKEAILNVERHSQAAHLTVSGRISAGHLVLTVTDDGVGMQATNPRPDSYGMTGMRERAHRLDATLTVRSGATGGTEVSIDLPLGGVLR